MKEINSEDNTSNVNRLRQYSTTLCAKICQSLAKTGLKNYLIVVKSVTVAKASN